MMGKTPGDLILWFFMGLFLVFSVLIGWLLLPFLSTLVLAAVVTGIFNPLYRVLIGTDKIRPSFAAFITCILIFFILFIPMFFFFGILSTEAYTLYLYGKSAVVSGQITSFLESSETIDRVNLVLSNFHIKFTAEELNRSISELGKFVGLFLFDQAKIITSNLLTFAINFFFMLLIIFFLLLDGGKLIAFIVDLSPLPREQDEKLIQKFKEMAGAILIGNGLAGVIQGVLGGLVFALFGLNSPFIWGVIMAFLAFLPIFGIGAVIMPAAIYLFLTGRILSGLFFICFYIILSFGIEYIFKPKVVGNRVKMHTLLVFLAIIGGMKLFGIMGIIYGPLVVTGFLTLVDIYHASYRKMVEPSQPVAPL